MHVEIDNLVEIIGPCTEDVLDCEIMRAAITLKEGEQGNERTQSIRTQLAKAACQDCRQAYLADLI